MPLYNTCLTALAITSVLWVAFVCVVAYFVGKPFT